jgi:acyl-CoA thioesterase-1
MMTPTRLAVVALTLGLVSLAFAPPGRADGPSAGHPPIIVACVGDSITAGAGAPKGKAYPNQLQDVLGQGWKIENFGRSGATLLKKGDRPYWKMPDFVRAKASRPNIVIIMLGTNDSKPQNWAHGDDFVADYRDLITIFQGLDTKPRIYLCHVPTVEEPNRYKITETASLVIDQRVDDLAKEFGLQVIPMDQAYGGDLSVLGNDRVHPNEHGALELAQTAAEALTSTSTGSASASAAP